MGYRDRDTESDYVNCFQDIPSCGTVLLAGINRKSGNAFDRDCVGIVFPHSLLTTSRLSELGLLTFRRVKTLTA